MAGKVQGLQKDGVLQFRGIPYARAERFGPSRPTDGWVGIRDATAFGPMAHQNPSPLEAMLGVQGRAATRTAWSSTCTRPQPTTPRAR